MSAPTSKVQIDDRRVHPREAAERDVFITAKGFSWTCRLVDVTPGGARVAFPGAAAWPNEIVFSDPMTGADYRARIAWRTEHDVGLQFIEMGRLADFLTRS